MPQTWITAYRQNQEQIGHLPADIALVAKFPNITVVDVDASLKQVQDVLDKLSAAIELLFSLTIAAGILVLGAALASTQDERMRDAGLLKALGASSAQVRKAFYTELILIGMVSGLLAAIAASVVGSLLAQRVFEMPLQASLNLYIYGIVAGTIASVIGGLWLDGKVSRSSALQVLRDAT
jgi:putative ABC transport system permease protein